MNTPITDQIMHLHKECMNKNSTPANEHVLRSHIERLERDRASLLEFAIARTKMKGGWKAAERVLASLEIKDDK